MKAKLMLRIVLYPSPLNNLSIVKSTLSKVPVTGVHLEVAGTQFCCGEEFWVGVVDIPFIEYILLVIGKFYEFG